MARDRVVGRPATTSERQGVRSTHSANRIGKRLAAIKKDNDMARPQTGGYAPKAGKARKSGPEKMRMSHIRLRKDLKRIEAEQAKAAAAEVPKARRR